MAGIGAEMTIAVFSAGIVLMKLASPSKATDIQSRTETNVSGHSEDEGNPQRWSRKTNTEHGDTHKPRAGTAGIEPTAIVALSSFTVY